MMKKWKTALKAKLKSLFGKEIDCSCFPTFDVGQDPRQGDLRIEKVE